MIEIKNATKEFKRGKETFAAVNDVSLVIKSGEMIALTGHSGSGKTTLLNMLAGLIDATSGSIVVDGKDITAMTGREKALYRNSKIGYVLQGDSLLSNFSIFDNICMPAYLAGSKDNIAEKAEELLAEVGLEDLRDEYPANLSGGEMRRAALARAVINSPDIVLADEPTSNLDPENSHNVMKLLRKISEAGTAVIFSTHEMEFLEYADREINLDSGRVKNGQ